jgi:hypothetical protein
VTASRSISAPTGFTARSIHCLALDPAETDGVLPLLIQLEVPGRGWLRVCGGVSREADARRGLGPEPPSEAAERHRGQPALIFNWNNVSLCY